MANLLPFVRLRFCHSFEHPANRLIHRLFNSLALLFGLNSAALADQASYRLENDSLVVQVAGDGRLSVSDKRTGVEWHQVELPLRWLSLEGSKGQAHGFEVDRAGRMLRWAASLPAVRKGKPDSWQPADFEFELTLDAEQPDLRLTLIPKIKGDWREAFYPRSFALADDDACLVFPHCEGA